MKQNWRVFAPLCGGLIITALCVSLQSAPCRAAERPHRDTARKRVALTEERLAHLKMPQGFAVSIFAQNLNAPAQMAVATDGTIYVLCPNDGTIAALHDKDSNANTDAPIVVAKGLNHPQGLCWRENKLYTLEGNALRAANRLSDGTFGAFQTIVNDISAGTERALAFGPDGKLVISGLNDGTLLAMKPDGSERAVFARGLQNTAAFDWNPDTGALWGIDRTAQNAKQDAPEELNEIEAEKDYSGAPGSTAPKPAAAGGLSLTGIALDAPEMPKLTCAAHSNSVGMAFYRAHAFAPEYWNDAFVVMRGGDDRSNANGYRIARVHFRGGRAARFEDFVTGFLVNKDQQFARLAGIAIAADGSLLVSDDENGVIYRISYKSGQN